MREVSNAAFRVLLLAISAVFQGCATAPPMPPSCAEIRQLYRAAAAEDFDDIRNKVEVRSDRSIYKTFGTTLKLTGADSCVIRESRLVFEYYCRWEAQDDDDKLFAIHEAVREKIVGCLKEAEVSRINDSVRVRVTGKEYAVEYYLAARRASRNYVTLAVRRQDL